MKVPSNRPSLRRALLQGCLLLTLAASGCSAFGPTGPTNVAQGKYYGTGHPEYDEFFLDLHRTQVFVAGVDGRLTSAHQKLRGGLGVSQDLPNEALIEHVRARARELSADGRLMKLQLSSGENDKPVSAVLLTRPAARDDQVRSLAEPIERAGNEFLVLRAELEGTVRGFGRLEARLKELRSRADQVFLRDGMSKIREVERNLDDAAKVLALMEERASSHRETSDRLLEGLVAASDTSAGVFDRPEPPPAEQVAQPESAPARPAPRRQASTPSSKPTPKPAAPKPAAPKSPPPKPAASEPAGFEP